MICLTAGIHQGEASHYPTGKFFYLLNILIIVTINMNSTGMMFIQNGIC
jgi:hypothetical protein